MRTGAAAEFDRLVDETGRARSSQAVEPVALFYTDGEFERQRADEPEPPKHSRARRRLDAIGKLAVLGAEATIGSALDFGSSGGQFAGGLFFGTIAYFAAVPEFKKRWRETKPMHQARLTAKERARGKD